MQWAVKAYHHAETYFNVSKSCQKFLTNKKDPKPIVCPALTGEFFKRCECLICMSCRVQVARQMCIVDGIKNTLQSYKNHKVIILTNQTWMGQYKLDTKKTDIMQNNGHCSFCSLWVHWIRRYSNSPRWMMRFMQSLGVTFRTSKWTTSTPTRSNLKKTKRYVTSAGLTSRSGA